MTTARIYAIASGKGGVGKTSLTLTMAVLLAKRKKRVLVVDADTGLANLDVQLNITPTKDLLYVVTGQAAVADVILGTPHGFDVIPGRAGHSGMANLSQAAVGSLMANLRTLTTRYDIILLDISAGVHAAALAFCAAADATLLITIPDPSSLTDAYALMKLLWKEHGSANVQLIINQASSREAAAVHAKLAHAAEHFLGLPDVPLLGHVPPCRQYASAVKTHQLPAIAYPNSAAVEGMGLIISSLESKPYR